MSFASRLNAYLAELGCTAQRLGEASGVSTAAISRYRKAERMPKASGRHIRMLASGIAELSGGRLDEAAVADDLARAAGGAPTDPVAYGAKLRALLVAVGANHNELSRALNFDPSFISRIIAGRRRPSDLREFTEGVARFAARRAPRDNAALKALLGEAWPTPDTYEQRVRAVATWLGSDDVPTGGSPARRFLQTVDAFDPTSVVIPAPDEACAAASPAHLAGTFTGAAAMKEAELAFVASALATGGDADVIMHSDMPFEELAADLGFARAWMGGLGQIIASGRRLKVIHNTVRSPQEMLLGLEGWIPFYMTGRVLPFYLREGERGPFMHLLRASEDVALWGEAVAGHTDEGRFVVTCDPDEVGYYHRRARRLFAAARPLMTIAREDDAAGLARVEAALGSQPEDRLLRCVPPGLSNVQVVVAPGTWALVTRLQGPKLHFLIEHPSLVDALEEFVGAGDAL